MENTNFAGKDGFIWWVGAIEDRADPLGIGRCQVRIFGWHTSNKLKLPKDDLPWAHPMYPLNSSRIFSAPQVGEWVVGFFLDGESAQQPVMMGILPGIKVTEFDDKISKIVIVGDSIAAGLSTYFPKAIVDAVVGRSTGAILSAVNKNKALHNADLAIVSSGTNDYPLPAGINSNPQATIANIAKTKTILNAKQYLFVLPFNRSAAADVTTAIGGAASIDLFEVSTTTDKLHPISYSAVAKVIKSKTGLT